MHNDIRAGGTPGQERKRKVVLLGPAPPLRGGIAAHTARLAEALVRNGHEAEVVSYSRLYPSLVFPGTCQRDAVAAAVGHELLDVLDPRTWLETRRHLARRPDSLVVFQWWHPVVAPALGAILTRLARDRVVAICHNVEPHEFFPLARLAAGAVLRRAGAILCHSRAVGDHLALFGLAPRVRLRAMPPLLAPRQIEEGAASAWADHHFGIAKDARVAVMAGHIRAYKGVDVLLEAWSRLGGERLANARLVLAGESYLGSRGQRRIRDAIAGDSRIIQQNRYLADEELDLLIKRADVLVLPYQRASQSGLIPLARAAGTPVL
ncbi:MAG TPA: glycosyltransferase family 4 protein, partial [Candidatus Binatia bacterium]|nr:glycosyltransferase family 4 protein [Candidatus Binatia bacterium]